MDECWLDVTGSTRIMGNGEKIANEIRERIKFELGLTISAGVSFNKIFAKLGSDMKKPDAVTVIPQDNYKNIVWNLPASDMLGVGRATERKLASSGIRTIGQIAEFPCEYLQRKLGKCGVDLWRFANGLDDSRVTVRDTEAPDKSVGHGMTAIQDLENPAEVWTFIADTLPTLREGASYTSERQKCPSGLGPMSSNHWKAMTGVGDNDTSVIAGAGEPGGW